MSLGSFKGERQRGRDRDREVRGKQAVVKGGYPEAKSSENATLPKCGENRGAVAGGGRG